MDKQQVREKAAGFLDEIREGVAKIIQEPGKGFYFGKNVSNWDETHTCGTVCCMQGWIPVIRPDIAKYPPIYNQVFSKIVSVINPLGQFMPSISGIPLGRRLWEALTIPEEQDYISLYDDRFLLFSNSEFEKVSSFWKTVSADIRSGKLDGYLLFDLLIPMDKYIEYIRKNAESLNLSYIAKNIGLSRSQFSSAVKGRKNSAGFKYKIPVRCLDDLKAYFERMNIVIPE